MMKKTTFSAFFIGMTASILLISLFSSIPAFSMADNQQEEAISAQESTQTNNTQQEQITPAQAKEAPQNVPAPPPPLPTTSLQDTTTSAPAPSIAPEPESAPTPKAPAKETALETDSTPAQQADEPITPEQVEPTPSEIETLISNLLPTTLRYEVVYAGQDAGELEILIRGNTSNLQIKSISHLSSMAQLFLDSYVINTQFSINEDHVRLLSGATKTAENSEIKHGFNINHHKQKVLFHSGDSAAFTLSDEFEADSFPLKLITSDLSSIKGKTILSISGKRITPYTYTETLEEELNLNGRTYQTVRVTRSKVNDPERTVTFWLDKDNHNLPVKIVSKHSGFNTELKIKT